VRYKDTGEIHKDFHLAVDRTITYIMEHYGEQFLIDLCKRTSQQVYQDIYRHLKEGDLCALAEHWQYYYTREGGEFTLTQDNDQLVLTVTKCPAAEHIIKIKGSLSPYYHRFDELLVGSWCEHTPFVSTFTVHNPVSYTITVRRNHASQ